MNTESLNELLLSVRDVFPDAVVSEAKDHEIIINTGLYSFGDPESILIDRSFLTQNGFTDNRTVKSEDC